ncbi:hypothetical protein Tco_1553278 [Tanacetum coccineum]
MFLLVAMDSADGSVFRLVGILLLVDSFLLTGCELSFLLDAMFLLVAMDSADGSVFRLVGILLLVDSFLLTGCEFLLLAYFLLLVDSFCWLHSFMLLELFLLSIHLFMLLNWLCCLCCAQFDIAGWLVSATGHSVSAGSLQSCWCNNVSAE